MVPSLHLLVEPMPRAAILLAALLVLPGCPSDTGGGGGPDGGDGGGVTQGLVFPFSATPRPPADLANGTVVTQVNLQLTSVRAIGDAAAGDSRTFRPALALEWAEMHGPDPLVFAGAPAGIYS